MKRFYYPIALLAGTAALMGIFTPLYKEALWFKAQMIGQDAVTLMAAVLFALCPRLKGPRREILTAGLAAYFLYTFFFYALQLALNPLFHLYLALVLLSGIELVRSIQALMRERQLTVSKETALLAGAYMGVVALMLTFLWNADIVATLLGRPLLKNPTGEAFTIVYVFDLTFVVPAALYALILLVKRHPFGIALTAVVLIKMTTMGAALVGMTVGAYVFGFTLDLFLVFLWGFLAAAGGGISFLFLRGIGGERG